MRHVDTQASAPRRLAHLTGALLLALTLASCTISIPINGTQGSGTQKTESRAVSGFSSVTLSGVGTVTIRQTGTESLTITTDDNILPLLTSTVSGGVLTLGIRPSNNLNPTKGIAWNLTVKNLTGITLSGAGTINVQDLTTTSLVTLVSGAGTVNVTGSATSQMVTVSGAGSYKGRNFTTTATVATISGAGSAIVAVSGTLNATVSGTGSVTYYGSPVVTQTVTGVGSVKQGS